MRDEEIEEYMDAVRNEYLDAEGLFDSHVTILFGGWIPAGIVAVVAGVVAALVAWNAWLVPAIVVGGTVLGYVSVIGAAVAFDYLDIRWLRTYRPDEAGWVILLSVGPAVALLVAVLALIYGLGLDPTPFLDLVLDHHLVVLPAIALVVWALGAIVEHYFGDEQHPPLDD